MENVNVHCTTITKRSAGPSQQVGVTKVHQTLGLLRHAIQDNFNPLFYSYMAPIIILMQR